MRREHNANGRPAPKSTLSFDGSAVHLGYMFDDGKAKAGATELAAARFVRAIKAFKNSRQITLTDARAGIADANRHLIIVAGGL